MVKLYLIKHALTKSFEEGLCLGKTDEVISPHGAELIQAGDSMYPCADLLFASDNIRCRRSAEFLYPFNELIVIKDFCDIDYGDYEGRPLSEVESEPAYEAFRDGDRIHMMPHGERFAHFSERVSKGALQVKDFILTFMDFNNIPYSKTFDMDKSLSSEDVNVVIIADGGVISELIYKYIREPYAYSDFDCDCGCGFMLELMAGSEERITLKLRDRIYGNR